MASPRCLRLAIAALLIVSAASVTPTPVTDTVQQAPVTSCDESEQYPSNGLCICSAGTTSFNWPVNTPASLTVNAQDGQDMYLTWFNGQYFINGVPNPGGMPSWLDTNPSNPTKSKTSINFSVNPGAPADAVGNELTLWVAYQKEDGSFVCQTIYTIKLVEADVIDEPKIIPGWSQCGGKGGECAQPKYGDNGAGCQDAPFGLGWTCAPGFACTRLHEWYWQCTPSATPPTPGITTIATWGQCGGQGGECGTYQCIDAVFPDTQCAPGSTCQRQHQWYWQCKP